MEDFSSMSIIEMLARRDAAEKEISCLIGKFVFTYSRLVTDLHLCVAWHNHGKDMDMYPRTAEDLSAADLLKKIERQVTNKFDSASSSFIEYKKWLTRAHQIRETRNTIMHSRWSIESYGRHAIATTTPVFVEPVKEVMFTADQLRETCQTCEKLMNELNVLRKNHPL